MFNNLDELQRTTIRSALLFWRDALSEELKPDYHDPVSYVDESLGSLTTEEIDELLVELGLA